MKNAPDNDAVAGIQIEYKVGETSDRPGSDAGQSQFLTQPRRSGHRKLGNVGERIVDLFQKVESDRVSSLTEVEFKGSSDVVARESVTFYAPALQPRCVLTRSLRDAIHWS